MRHRRNHFDGFLFDRHPRLDVKACTCGFAPIAIGLCLTLIHLISIPVTNTSVNPARSLGVALFGEPWALQQVWFFWVMPLIGAGLGGGIYRFLLGEVVTV
ncbi:MAG: aquaporin [Asticcacaulis sp.]